MVADGKKLANLTGRIYLWRRGTSAAIFGVIKRVERGPLGQSIYTAKPPRNFNPMMATARITSSPKSKNHVELLGQLDPIKCIRPDFRDGHFQGPQLRRSRIEDGRAAEVVVAGL